MIVYRWQFHTPVAVTLASAPSVSAKIPNVQVRAILQLSFTVELII